ncbi:MAG: NAD(P)-dependent oxidoreductase [Ardenticatenaceae bacterium]|nr:NAD(P)-dependent oxidoreductase [Ardenticatenaceae bacterium]
MSYLNNALQGKKVVVTGATGFIGGRLAQRLAAEEGARVTGTGRDLSKVPFVKDAGVTLKAVDLLDEAQVRELLVGQEVLFHVAGWVGKGSYEDAYRVNVTATENVLRQAAAAGVQRIVHLSTVGAYGPPHRDMMDETHPIDTEQEDVYGRSKAHGEVVVRKLIDELGLKVAIIRPAMVYGPRAYSWTLGLYRMVKKGVPVLFGKADGHSHPVYIDNLVDGIMLTAVHPQAIGEAFNFCDRPVQWDTWWGYYGQMAGRKLRRVPMWIAKIGAVLSDTFKLKLPLSRVRLTYYRRKLVFPIEKARRLLGYEPRISLDEGMKRSEAWLREEGHL